MPRPRYLLPPAGVYHVTTRGVGRMAIARDDHDFRFIDRGIAEAAFRFGWIYHAHCVMPNHYHLIVETELRRLSKVMQWLNWRVARRFNERYDRVGHFVEKRFDSWVIDGDDHFANACAYVLHNAVRARLVDAAGNWPWCGLASGARRGVAPLRGRQRRRPRAQRGDVAAAAV